MGMVSTADLSLNFSHSTRWGETIETKKAAEKKRLQPEKAAAAILHD